jgi:hypothetical protein
MCNLSFSQYKIINAQDAMIYTPEQIDKLNKRTCELISKLESHKLDKDSIYIYNVYHFETYKRINKEDFKDPLFFKKLNLQPIYVECEVNKGVVSQLPSSEAIVFDNKNKFIGIGYVQFFTSVDQCSPSVKLYELPMIEKKRELQIRFFFDIINLPCRCVTTFGRTYDDKIIVFHSKGLDPITITPIEEFVDKYWDEYCY